MSRFVRPQTRTLTLANGDQLIVRERLTAGEQRAQRARVFEPGPDGGAWRPNPLLQWPSLILAYLLDWNLKDDQDQPSIRDLSPEAMLQVIDSLDTESFDEILEAIQAHEREMDAAREQKKNNPGWRHAVTSDLIIARRFGWRYEWVRDMDADVHQVLVEELIREHEAAEAAR